MHSLRKCWKIICPVWVMLGLAFTVWLFWSYQAKGVDARLFQSDGELEVVATDDYVVFTPRGVYSHVVFFYPGALVDVRAYAPLCRQIAEGDHQVYLIKMPWRLSSKGYRKPEELNLMVDKSRHYVLAGHSLGGKMAAKFADENPGKIRELILLGTTHPRDFSLRESPVRVLKLFGSKDGVAEASEVLRNRILLPESAEVTQIEGANHGQFGHYGPQLGDGRATITRDEQQRIAVEAILRFLAD